MQGFLDALQDLVAWAVTATILAFATWVGWVTKTVNGNKTRLAVLEAAVGTLPKQLEELKDTLADMREEASNGRERLYRHVDNVRKELRDDIKEVRGGS
jgi:hypothetical protein